MTKPIIFLDFDGVVNTIYYRQYPRMKHLGNDGWGMYCAMPDDGFVSNRQAIEWLNELYKKNPYDIVVSSTWRLHKDRDCSKILYNSGLSQEIKILGTTPCFSGRPRGEEIQAWIDEHNFIGNFVILDDDSDMAHLIDKLVHCDSYLGFTLHEMNEVESRFERA